jgi:hypothetical protein
VNHYGHLALEHSRRHRPQAYAAILDPTTHFTEIGEEVQAAVTELRDRLLGPPPPNESPYHYQQRGFQALRTAEEVVLADQVWLEPEPEPKAEPDPQLEAYYANLQTISLALNEATQSWDAEEPPAPA